MKIFSIIYLHLIILIISSRVKRNKKTKRNLDDPISPKVDETEKVTPQTEQRELQSSASKTTNFSEIWRTYYKENMKDNNEYLEYPEPLNGWEDEVCQNSGEQSPINIPYETDINIIKDGSNVDILSINYNYLRSGSFQYQLNHAWGIGITEGGSIHVMIEKKEYEFYLSEIYIHLYSEHRLQNKQYPLEIEFVHYSSTYQETKEKLIISAIFDYSNNIENYFISTLNIRNGLLTSVIDFSEIISNSKPFYYYKGSLTIPPCSYNVHRIVYKDVFYMSFSQFENIRLWIENSNKFYYGRGYGNARGIKPLNGRKIFYESKNKISKKMTNDKIRTTDSENSWNYIGKKMINVVNIILLFDLVYSLF